MKKTVAAIACAIATVLQGAPLWAADLPSRQPVPAPPPLLYNWSGLYIGVNGGGLWGQSRHDEYIPPVSTTGNFNVSGGLVGGTVGFNWQTGPFVAGAEGDVDWVGASGTTACPVGTFTCSTKASYLATLRGRAGFAWDKVLFYGTGGAAFGDIRQSFAPPFGGVNGSSTDRVGWAAGAGVEIGITQNLTAKVEYLHADLGTFSCGYTCVGVPGEAIRVRLSENIVKAGLNYRFNWPSALGL